MDLDEQIGVEDNLERVCSVCGAALTQSEIETSREAGTFLCTVHATEEATLGEAEAEAEL